ncbi:MAG: TIR domain-containing protein [Deltaproteobacteria bacterium]|nr:TIR domain-containing protein [Deltaproteobacteria bacterium]
MDVLCNNCGVEYSLDEILVAAAGTAVRCTSCGRVFRVYRPETADSESDEWVLRQPNGSTFPFQRIAVLQQWIAEGKVSQEDLLSRPGGPWKRLGDIQELRLENSNQADNSAEESGLTDIRAIAGAVHAGIGKEAPNGKKANTDHSVFVSYRRDDSKHVAGRLVENLDRRLADNQVFYDVDSIPFGVDFRTHISERLSNCRIVLVLIGSSWINCRDKSGRRLMQSNDHVRLEIEAALSSDATVVPVLVDGATMPSADQLPESIQSLSFLNAAKLLDDPQFQLSVTKIVDFLVEQGITSK